MLICMTDAPLRLGGMHARACALDIETSGGQKLTIDFTLQQPIVRENAAQDAQELLARWIEKAEGNLVAILDDIEPCAAHIDSEIGALRHARGRAFQNEANGNTWWTAFDDVVVE